MRPCIVVLACSLFIGGCAATDGTRHDTPATATAPVTPPPDATPAQQPPGEFVAGVDTIEAAGTAGAVVADSSLTEAEALFSVQIGAYKEPVNASAAQSTARERYNLPVLNEFQERPGLYRIRIGAFASREEAAAHLARMRSEFPVDYKDSFILQLKR
jgi:cell division septation protein DedD